MNKKWVHIIGIAGVTTSALALEFKRIGWEVTGSDKNIYPPTSDILADVGITLYTNFSYKNLIKNGKSPDLVIFTASKSVKNKEYLFAKKQQLLIKTFPEVLHDRVVVHGKSIVVTGSYGKTSITSMLSYVFQKAGINISYMFGGFSPSFTKTIQFRDDSTEWSIVEGDEYIASKVDPRSKFYFYDPSVLVINSIEWDHTDVFKTKEDYIENFRKLVQTIPAEGKIFAVRSENIDLVLEGANAAVIYFDSAVYSVKTNLLGNFNNTNAAFVNQIAQNLGVEADVCKEAIFEFRGISRRLEKRYENENCIIIDDFGSSPSKAKGSLFSLREEFPNANIISVFEPNEGARTNESLAQYDSTIFSAADIVVFPEFREIPERMTAPELYEHLQKDDSATKYFNLGNDDLVKSLKRHFVSDKKNIIVFMGSHNFEGMIQEVIKELDSDG